LPRDGSSHPRSLISRRRGRTSMLGSKNYSILTAPSSPLHPAPLGPDLWACCFSYRGGRSRYYCRDRGTHIGVSRDWRAEECSSLNVTPLWALSLC
jgi:hypothetical protein